MREPPRGGVARSVGRIGARVSALGVASLGALVAALVCGAASLPATSVAESAQAGSASGGDLTPTQMSPPRKWLYLFEQTPTAESARDESIYKRYAVQWTAQAPTPALNPDEFTLRLSERGGPLPPPTREVSYGLWPSCLQGPLPTLPQACATGEEGEFRLDGETYPVWVFASDRQAIFWSPTLGIVEDAFVDDDHVLNSRKLIGFDFGARRGGDTTPPTVCDWHTSLRIKGGAKLSAPVEVTLQGAHGEARAALTCAADVCALTLHPSGQRFGLDPYSPTALKAWRHPTQEGFEVVMAQGESPTGFAALVVLLTPGGAKALTLRYPKPVGDAAFSALLMQRDAECTLQARLKVGDITQAAEHLLSPEGLSAVGGGSLRALPSPRAP
jgi:hypothetical protein